MGSLKKKARKAKSSIRALIVMVIILLYSSLFFVGGIGDIIVRRENLFKLFAFFFQDVFEIIFGILLVILGVLYFFLGCCQETTLVYEYLRIGRRSILHLVYLTVWVGFLNCLFCCFCLFHLGSDDREGCKIDGLIVFFGFNGGCVLSGFRIAYLMGSFGITIICLIVYIIDFVRSSTFGFLKNKKKVVGVYEFIDFQRRLAPRFTFHIECYHYEQVARERTITETDSEGNQRTRTEIYYETVKVTTYTDWIVWRYSQFADASGKFMLDGKHFFKNFIKVKLDNEIVFDSVQTKQIYEQDAQEFYRANCWRDTHCDLSKRKSLPGFEKHVLANLREGGKEPWFANIYCYLLCFCLGCQLFFRHWFDRVAGEQDFVLLKIVSATDTIQLVPEVDQNYDVNFVIVPDFRSISSSNVNTVVSKETVKKANNEGTPLLKKEPPTDNPDFIPGQNPNFVE